MLERVTETEEEEQQRAFRPSAKGRSTGRGDQHQGVDLEPAEAQVVDRFAEREEAAEEIGRDEAGGRQPLRRVGHKLLDAVADPEQRTAGESEDQLGVWP